MKRWISKVKQLKTILSALAIAVALLAANTACTSEGADNTVPEQPQQPDTPSTGGITITVGAGISDDVAQVRSVVAMEDGKRALHFTNGDKLYVYGNLPSGYYLVGTLDIDASSISASGKSANFSGTIKVYNSADVDVDTYPFTDPSDPLADCVSATAHLFHKDMKADIYTIQANHTLVYNTAKAFAADVETLMKTVLKVSGDYDKLNKKFSLGSTDAILNCTLSGLAASTSYKVKLNSDSSPVATYDFSTDANGIGTIAFVSSVGSYARILNILQSDGTTLVGDIDLGTHNFTAKVYNVMRNWLYPDFRTPTDLATVATPYTAKNGEILTGKLGGGAANTGNVKIEAGATVVLHNVEITSVNTDGGKQYAGIDCEGDATIILSGTNKVKGGAELKPAIYIPKDYTLTIRGSGSLEADGTGCGAGIGGGEIYDCGNIVIAGGDITAKAGTKSAAIGSGNNRSCGAITISGGTVTASTTGTGTGGGAAIGSGDTGSCGTISISGGTVTATSSSWGAAIGSGYNSVSCGPINISGGNVTATSTGIGAGIGSGKGGNCTGISITGGTIEAEGTSGAGIGSGSDSGTKCGDITISGGTVTARKSSAPCSIGKGDWASCGTVTIGGTEYPDGIATSPYTYPPQP